MKKRNNRQLSLLLLVIAILFLSAIAIAGYCLRDAAGETDFTRKDIAPGAQYPFGTDWMGRDMFTRTLCGLSMSIRIGLLTASISAAIALVLGSAAAMGGKTVDSIISWVIDLGMGIPHILLLMLISFACGKGFTGVVVGVTLTHWMSLARLIRAEVLQLKQSGYILVARKLGVSRFWIVVRHMLPHLFPQFMVGLVLLFPHAILHEASITFLGFGLSPEQPAIGIILSESMRYLTMGKWWLALFPGLMLVLTVLLFNVAGSALRKLTDPASAHR
jgi:peptide/nickel transport system permease protein